ncbi:TPA: hypothetical protein ACWQU1_004582 [Escherichia coli]
MSMQTVRRKALRQNPYSTLGKPPLRSSRDRITRAINGTWSLRELPDNVRELLIERAALRAEITTLTVKAQGLKKSDVSVLIAGCDVSMQSPHCWKIGNVMPDITPAPASLLEAVFTPMTEYTHNVYSVKGDRLAMTLTKIGVAQANSQGDIQLFINPDCATGKVLLYRKD